MALKEKAKKKREQRETPVPTLKSTISSDMLEQAKEKLRNEAGNTQASINVDTPSLPNVAGVTPTVQSVTPQATGVTEPEMPNPVKATAQERLKTPSFSDLLANSMYVMRKNAEKEKTDAVKMQQYYAFADALNAIGKLGGSAVGGAIGGNVADSAPAVDPYKESRGYLAAFEKAKAANERLRDLDDKAYALAATQEEREYNRKVREADNAYKAKLAETEREWQKDFFDYKAKAEQAIAQGNMEFKAKLDAGIAAKKHEYDMKKLAVQNAHDVTLKGISERIVRMQLGLDGDDGMALSKTTPFTFSNGTKADIPKKLFPEMLKYFAKKGINGQEVDAEDVESALRDHPELVNGFLRIYGYGKPVVEDDTDDTTTPKTTTNQSQWYSPWYVSSPEDLTNPMDNTQIPPASGIQEEYSIENDPFASFLEN